MAVMTSQMPTLLDGTSDSISTSSVRNRRTLKSLVANSTLRTKSLPPGVQRNTLSTMAQPPLQPLPSTPADHSQSQTASILQTRPKSTSVSVASSVRPSPRFHVANPTELSPLLTLNKAPVTKTLESNRPLPAPVSSTGSGGSVGRKQPGPPPPPRINTTGLHVQSIPSPAVSHSSVFPSGSISATPSTSSSTSITPKHMPKVSLPIGPIQYVPAPLPLSDASFRTERTTTISTLPSPSNGTRAVVRPLPPPPLPKAIGASFKGLRPRSSSRGSSSKVRARTNSAVGREDVISRPQLSFDPTSSSYVIRTAHEVNGLFSTSPSTTATGVGSIKGGHGSRNPRIHTHNRSHSAQTKNFSSMIISDGSDIRDITSSASSPNNHLVTSRKGKQVVRSAPCSDTEESPFPQPKSSEIRQSRRKVVLHNPSSSIGVRSAPTSDTEDSPTYEFTSSPLLLPPTGSIKDMLPKPYITRTDNLSQPQPIKPPFLSTQAIPFESLTISRQTPPTNLAQGTSFPVTTPPFLPSLPEDIGYADSGFVDDSRIYVDDGFDGPGGLGAFSTSIDPEVDVDIGDMVFNPRPPSGELMGPSVMDLDMDARGRHVSRPTPVPRWKSADPHTMNADLQRHESGKFSDTKSSHNASRGSRSTSHAMIMSSLRAHVHVYPVQQLEPGPSPINMDLEPEMVFSKNPRSFTPSRSVPGVLDMGERRYVRGKWRSPSPTTPSETGGTVPPRNPVAGQFAPMRARGFYEDW
ncbi:hypothetical protein J3R30DRAFT_3703671 [Lentinula aciculospora]|uniref:Uncharacterized protein n=1 Tax=Lentinula aciculospora TaxID=153920 RepID=A0A9W9A9X8_9AGAR|nr:hypothetical protein J3R30DRAFT_3703671 [Lentinula aciculospora]